ncbi:MAG: helix-turn-helix transcriptional regulator [Paracoccaceae bacterium]
MAKGFHDERYRTLIAALVAARTKCGLSQQQLADRLGTHQQFVSRFELGERRLDVVEFADVAVALGLDPAALVATID